MMSSYRKPLPTLGTQPVRPGQANPPAALPSCNRRVIGFPPQSPVSALKVEGQIMQAFVLEKTPKCRPAAAQTENDGDLSDRPLPVCTCPQPRQQRRLTPTRAADAHATGNPKGDGDRCAEHDWSKTGSRHRKQNQAYSQCTGIKLPHVCIIIIIIISITIVFIVIVIVIIIIIPARIIRIAGAIIVGTARGCIRIAIIIAVIIIIIHLNRAIIIIIS